MLLDAVSGLELPLQCSCLRLTPPSFLELCVQLRKGRTAKEGLHLYKNVAQTAPSKVWEEVWPRTDA